MSQIGLNERLFFELLLLLFIFMLWHVASSESKEQISHVLFCNRARKMLVSLSSLVILQENALLVTLSYCCERRTYSIQAQTGTSHFDSDPGE